MGETSDGSSSAAQSAQESDRQENTGILSRLFGGLFQSDPSHSSDRHGTDVSQAQSQPRGMLNLHRMRVEDVAIPKVEIISVSDDIKKDELVQVFRESGLSRLPVYDGTLDTPVGMVHVKDLALRHGFNGSRVSGRYTLSKLLRPLLFAPPSMPIGVLLQKMQTERIHMALVIDEYGGVDGLVTIEDLIEQVIGEIEDEHDQDEGQLWTRESSGNFLVEARAPLEDFEAEIGQSLTKDVDDEEIDTLGGLVFVLAGRVPARGEVILHPNGPDLEVVDADPRRIKRLRVHLVDRNNG